MKKIIVLLIVFSSYCCQAQSVTGYWYGTANIAGQRENNYLIEMILNQDRDAVKAIFNYYFRDSYRSMQVTGRYNSMTRELSLFNIPLPYFGSTAKMQVDCSMDLIAMHRVAIAGSNLVGRFVGREGYKYTCPELLFDFRRNEAAGNQDSILTALKNFKESYQLWTPSANDTLVAVRIIQRPIENIVVKKNNSDRQLDVQNEIEVSSDSIQVDFYDNGEVDGDSISVFFNGQLLGANLRLSTKAIHLNIKLDSTRSENTLSMFANNLGFIPPNTALMLIYDGKKRYEVRLMSNMEKSGAIRIKRAAPTKK